MVLLQKTYGVAIIFVLLLIEYYLLMCLVSFLVVY